MSFFSTISQFLSYKFYAFCYEELLDASPLTAYCPDSCSTPADRCPRRRPFSYLLSITFIKSHRVDRPVRWDSTQLPAEHF